MLPTDPCASDTADVELDVDDLFEPPLASAQNKLVASGTNQNRARLEWERCPSSDVFVSHRRRDMAAKTTGMAERSAGDDVPLNVFMTSSVTMGRLFEDFKKKMSTENQEMHKAHLAEIQKLADGVTASVRSEIRSIQGLFGILTNGLKGVQAVRTVGKTSLSDWEQKLEELTPHAKVIFGRELFSRILCFNYPLKAVEIYSKSSGCNVERASTSAQTLLFSLQPGDKKYRYSGDIGKLHSEFKFSVIQNTFFNVCRDSFDMFRSSSSSSEQGGGSESGALQAGTGPAEQKCRIIRPSWLDAGKVTVDHINEARIFLESPNQSRKGRVRKTPMPHDIACHGALRVYRLLGAHLHEGRGNLRSTFFQGLGYLLVPWKDHVEDNDQYSMKMGFSDGEDDDLSLSLEEIPYTEQCSFNADMPTSNAVDVANKEILRKLFSECRGMILSVEHEVHVVSGNGVQRKHSGGEKKTIHRLINLIDVACDCCVEYCRVGSRELFLRTHNTSLQCVLVFALLFKAICMEFMATCNPDRSSSAPRIPGLTDVKVFGSCLKDMIPGVNTQKNLLKSRCLRMTANEYDLLNHPPEEDENHIDDEKEPDQVFDMRQIQESMEYGVAVI